ncbi:MAG: TetR/AcrR family transcriptional regulator [Caulobacterales bacterium]
MLRPPTPGKEDAPAGVGSAKDARRDAVLEAAAREFNASGAAGASFTRIARDIGLGRAALYYYVRDRQDLVLQCYRRTCAQMAADLATAEASAGDGLARLVAFVRAALDPERAPTAVLSELDYLTGDAHTEIAVAHAANVTRLRALIRGGVSDGGIRECDDEAIAQAIVGVIGWIPLSVDWVEGTDPGYRARTVQAVVDLLTDGYAADTSYLFNSPVRIDTFFAAAPKPFDRAGQADAKVEQLLMTASRIINRRGVDGASLDDITGALGATKGAFYHYLRNKTDLVVRCYQRALRLNEAFAAASGRLGRSGLEKTLIGLYLNVQAQASDLAPMIQLVGVESLPPAFRREIRQRSSALQRTFSAYAAEGLADGTNRDVDLDAIAQLGAGVFEWLPKWFDPADPRASGALAGEYCRLFIAGLRRR